jgi:transcriptional regulator with GAF, ATPase, and Fis domain
MDFCPRSVGERDDVSDPRLRIQALAMAGGREPGPLPPPVEEALRAGGVELLDPDADPDPSVPALIWLSAVDDAALEIVRALNPGSARQVLVVADRPEVLGRGAVWRILEAGAADALVWDDQSGGLALAIARLRRWAAVDALCGATPVQERLFGASPAWRTALRQLVELAAFTDSSLLLVGESGVGKEEAARLVHALDQRRAKRAMVVVDCTTVTSELSGSEFFGHERGAFTGAAGAREGAFGMADGGTLFLDEIGELPLPLQAQLLRVIQEGTYKRVGADVWRRVDLRLVCATNRDLLAEVEQGRFRRDLYHRIAAAVCRLPPLRERCGDVLLLARRFLREALPEGASASFDPSVEGYLVERSYPGNVRDLRQLVLRMGKRHAGGGVVTPGDIPPDERPCASDADSSFAGLLESAVRSALSRGVGLKEIGRLATEAAIRLVLAEETGNLQRAARRLGITDRALQFRRARKAFADS